jgi:hypothetical protein
MSTTLQITSEAKEHLAEGKTFLEEQTLGRQKSLIHRVGIQRPTASERKAQNLKQME